VFNSQVEARSWVQIEFSFKRKKRSWVVVEERSGVNRGYFLKKGNDRFAR